MALVVKDRVKESTTTTGTADFTLVGASSGFQTFAVIGNGNSTYYAATDQATGAWEVGIGTYSTTGPTLTRDTVLESSNSGSKVVFAAGTKEVFCTYPAERSVYLDAAGSAVTVLDIGTLGTSTANITTANITAGTVSTTPTSNNDIANKVYVDTIASSGITYHTPVKYEVPNTTGNLNATYNQPGGPGVGVGATLTNAGTLAAFAPDGPTASPGDRILVYNQTNAFQNGVYTVTTVGNGSTAWVLTRATDADTYAVKSPTSLGNGDAFFVTSGNTGAGETYVCNTPGTITFGTTAITFAQISDATLYTAGTGLTLTGTEFSITNTGTVGTYGSASNVPVFVTNAQGQVTSVTNTAISISAGSVSGLAASATTDTTNAANITAGTLNSARLTGSYTGITGVGTIAAGTWNGTAIGATYGGTGQTAYTVGDLLYADSTASLAKLADVATGNALLSGGVGTAPAWGKIGLGTHVSGTLPVGNGGTGAITLTGYVKGNGASAFTASASIPNADTTATSANTASAIVARDASGNFSAGTITASLNGNASTATTASNVNNGALTLAVAGTGLSGSATFTANQSGNSTFTVTSNATNANTASTIVARDASGNFSAGTITASLSGNATSATTATTATTANALNTGNSYTGTAFTASSTDGYFYANRAAIANQAGIQFRTAGTTNWYNFLDNNTNTLAWYQTNTNTQVMTLTQAGAFNVVGTITQSGSQVLTAGNFNSYAPTLTGGGASGTWGINISGNAATATTATNQSGGSVNATTGSFNNLLNSNYGITNDATGSLRIFAPGGASYATGASTVTGAIKIRIPAAALGSNTMISFKVKIYQYSTGLSAELEIGGYNYSDAPGTWYNVSATNLSQSLGDLTVRFGKDGTSQCVYIGDLASTWYYPQVVVTEFFAGYSNYSASLWASGWNISFEASAFAGVTNTITANRTLSSANYNSYSPTLTGGGASGTWGINITGNAATATTASNSNALNNLSSTQLFNNMGQNHNTYTDANSFTNFGTQFLQGTTNGPGAGGSQWYMFGLGLGNDYAYSSYAMQLAVPRTPLSGNPYVSVRFREGGTWNSWAKIWAGYADSAGSATTATTATSATNVTGTVAVANGGTGATSFGTGVFLIGSGTSAVGGGIFFHDSSTTYTMRPPNGGPAGSVVLTMGPTSTAGSAEINLNAIGGGLGNGIINSTAPLELRRSGTTVATVDTNNITLAASKSLTFSYASGSPTNTAFSAASRTVAGVTANSIIASSSGGATNVHIEATFANSAGLWLTPNSTGSGTGNIGTTNNLDLRLYRNGTIYQTLDANGTVFASGRNIGVGGTSPSTSGAGITFPATQSASTDVNTLDDYEEGTFTPTITGTTTAGTGSYNTFGQVGVYSKVGRVVTVQIRLSWNSHSGTGNMQVSGLPFANSLTTAANAASALRVSNIALTANNVMTATLTSGGTTISLFQYPVGGGLETSVPMDTAGEIYCTLTYSSS